MATTTVTSPAARLHDRSPEPRGPALFVGRARELETIHRSFEEGARLISVLGPGGMGKTCLARQFARSTCVLPSGLLDLSSAASLDELLACVADGLGIELPRNAGEGEVCRRLAAALRALGPCLVILDNFERLVRFAADTVERWLAEAPEVSFLVTSREPLGLGEEVRLLLGPWSVEEGVAFFAARARALLAGGELADSDRAIVAQLVERVDGIPLALELAAARLPVLSPAEILDRVRRRFELLRCGRRDVPRRHATLHAALDWSWDLLDEGQRLAFLQCSVFSSRFSLEAAEAVLDLGDGQAPLDVLQSLVEKSLVVRASAPGEPARFTLFETMREYAAAKLADSPARARALARHAGYFAGFADACAADAWGERARASVEALAGELPNLLDVVRRAEGHPDEAARIAVALEPLLYTRGPFGRSLGLLDTVVHALDRVKDPALAAQTLVVRAAIRRVSGRVADAEEDLGRAAALLGARGTPALEARIFHLRGNLARDQLRVGDALELFTAAIARAREARDARTLAHALTDRATVRYDTLVEDPGAAEALAIAVAAKDLRMTATVSVNRALMPWVFGAVAEACAHVERALPTLREVADRELEGVARIVLGSGLACAGDLPRAEAELREAGRIAHTLGRHFFLPMALSFLGLILLWGPGRRGEARAALAEALSLGPAGGPAIIARVGLGTLAADDDDLAQAEAELELGRRELGTYPEPNVAFCVEVLEGLIALARARQRASAGDVTSAGELRRVVSRRVEAWLEPWAGPGRPARLRGDPRLGALGALLTGPIVLRALAEADAGHPRARGDVDPPAPPAGPAPPETPLPAADLTVGPGGRWFRAGAAEEVDLSTRQVFRRLLGALLEHHRAGHEDALTVETLIAAAWPGERISGSAARNRLHNAVATLRSLGLRALVVTDQGGYRLRRGANVVCAPDPDPHDGARQDRSPVAASGGAGAPRAPVTRRR
ncbi:AAA family ATPase [Sorangium atrum]|uniref:AAA family ATPase n=1 Tax=Sorangium atrum TaxID=2995308 RepID=A0ABT5BZJ5_9BACT|nr:AAA family ATPase [Sorangium aterium]MDC0679579.1 AAA family ATPase [Sorangium aterium]